MHDDLLNFILHSQVQNEVMVRMGDTLSHLQRPEDEQSQELAARLGTSCHASGRTTPFASLHGQTPDPQPWCQCYRPETLTYITATGNVLPCCISPFDTSDYQTNVRGNVFAEPLIDIWHGCDTKISEYRDKPPPHP